MQKRPGNPMRNLLTVLSAAAALVVGQPAMRAQVTPAVPSTQEEVPPAPKINLTMEQRHIIKEIVLKDLKPKKVTAELSLSIGDPLPSNVEAQPFPSEVYGKVPQVKSHAFFVIDERVVVVSPKDNKIADIIE